MGLVYIYTVTGYGIECTKDFEMLPNAGYDMPSREDGMTGYYEPASPNLLHPNTTAKTIMTKTRARMTSKQHAFPLAFF